MISLSIFSVLFVFLEVKSENVEIITSFGTIKGIKTSTVDCNSVHQFRKIPYAEPPIGNLRFQKPVPHPPLSGIYDATEFGPSCMQMTPILSLNSTRGPMSEDCLHLNIYIPNSIVSIPRAVMLWIHGGGFQTGQGSIYNGENVAVIGNVIVITINYRLDLFGFMSTDDNAYRGNYGLFDQLEAIRWTKKYIGSFGGDPNKITIFGESAGAFSIAMLSISPLSKELFQRAIMESGGDFTKKNVDRDLRNVSIGAMQLLGCLMELK
ncbi:hypothetical protein FSP39_007701 [Pinctada imbricata]|uniref:Carboxylic ester hydrolase n=1 Tax=Pinctada imbricata TaxID=66713 RepID=A0AA88YC64_PINIB|nr:hypothetical protein FSP39_007701 [Pinctada imbricata]